MYKEVWSQSASYRTDDRIFGNAEKRGLPVMGMSATTG